MILLNMPELFGIGLEVYIILLVLGTPMFFFWRWLFKHIKPGSKRLLLTCFATIIGSPIIYLLFIAAFIFCSEYYPNRDFDKKQWLADSTKRYEYSKDIISSKMLIGKTQQQVKQILGDSGNKDSEATWYYELGYRPQITGIDPDYLEIDFKYGKATEIVQHFK